MTLEIFLYQAQSEGFYPFPNFHFKATGGNFFGISGLVSQISPKPKIMLKFKKIESVNNTFLTKNNYNLPALVEFIDVSCIFDPIIFVKLRFSGQ